VPRPLSQSEYASRISIDGVGGRAQFATTAKARGLGPERLQDYLSPMAYRHYLAAERYDKFDIWKMMGATTPSRASSAA
jgi:hypothetical protein